MKNILFMQVKRCVVSVWVCEWNPNYREAKLLKMRLRYRYYYKEKGQISKIISQIPLLLLLYNNNKGGHIH